MPDREKVIKGLECCLPMTTRDGYGDCHNCPYDRRITIEGGICECCHDLMSDAIALLKAQEPREMSDAELMDAIRKAPIMLKPAVDAAPVVRCRDCKYAHMTYDGEVKYCDRISMPDDEGDYGYALYLLGDWFCADGERKEE